MNPSGIGREEGIRTGENVPPSRSSSPDTFKGASEDGATSVGKTKDPPPILSSGSPKVTSVGKGRAARWMSDSCVDVTTEGAKVELPPSREDNDVEIGPTPALVPRGKDTFPRIS